ncbi:MAG: hypothetical protein NTW29_12415 [Bacteroidetes bacterium]|nr:hypothetical protein [Bacteroidota bacterium]
MEKINEASQFWKAFLQPRVLLFILFGAGIIFLTFLTNNNALEIVISGIASVFIGIGVNNFSSIETHVRDEKKLKSKIAHSLKVLEITRSRIKVIHHELNRENCLKLKEDLAELEKIIVLSMGLIKDEDTLN